MVTTQLKSLILTHIYQSEQPRPIPRNSVKSDIGCTSMIYFYDAGNDESLTLHNGTLVSQTSVIAAEQTVINNVYVVVFSIKYSSD